jgi:signal transduction histidine kinase
MDPKLQVIADTIQQTSGLSEAEKEFLLHSLKEADKAQGLSKFKLERLEHDKQTLSVMLEETIEDLQKKSRAIEQQNRELEIESALERVRAVALSMMKPQDMLDVCRVISNQLELLKVKDVRNVQTAIFYETKGIYVNYEFYARHHKTLITEVSYEDHPVSQNFAEQMLKGPNQVWMYAFKGQEVKDWLNYQKGTNVFIDTYLENADTLNYYWYSLGPVGIGMSAYTPLREEEIELFKRFRNVFELAYRRYLDIEKAEAQAREARIEAALEKVRSRSLGMHKSDELQEVVHTVFERLKELNVKLYTAIIIIFKEGSKDIVWWMENKIKQQYPRIVIKYADIAYLQDLFKAKEKGKELFSKCYVGEQKDTLYQYLFEHTDLKSVAEEQKRFLWENEFASISIAFAKNTAIHLTSYSERSFSEEDNEILKRFAKVFDQAYTRFRDLQKAEAQARESQIEAALERVRTRAMAMHKADDLNPAVAIVFEELDKLNLGMLRCGIGIINKENRSVAVWTTSASDERNTVQVSGAESMDIHPLLQGAFDAWIRQSDFSYRLEGDDLLQYYKAVGQTNIRLPQSQAEATTQFYYVTSFGSGGLFAFRENEFSDEGKAVMKRFANVFNLTYKRFLDLQKAEAQARQAKIESSMEKVRSRAMAMQKPAELVEVAKLLRTEMGLLGVEELETSSIYIHNESTQQTECWYAIQKDGKLVSDHMTIDLRETFVGREMLTFYRSGQKQTSIVMQGEPRKEWINYCADHSTVLIGFYGDVIPDRTYHLYKFSHGYMGAASPGDISAESWDLLQRATLVFSLAYTRFSDLQLAEAQAREAQIETALERVRSRTLAMQRSDELAETASVLFKQLIHLGIEPNRLYICIGTDEIGGAEFWITDEEGSKISMAYSTNMNNNPSMKKMYEGWKAQNKSLIIDMQGEELHEYFKFLDSLNVPFKGGLSQKRRMQYIAYFGKGFIGMASPDEQPAETMQLLERFAVVFNLTFTRFNDLKIAEAHALQAEQDLIEIKAAKRKAEDTLTELQTTQRQLVQSEKMASLGELTAGIAHEIQNPLNFVNNFSDVSNELLDEMRAELEKGNTKDAASIVDDVKQNLEKILYHGRRADAIVKGMLQHSRTSSGQKELTDINSLADEYLRLAYHGLRAKDKSFHAKLITGFDKDVGKINLIPQEIGRVILNLINNAFYAVSEKQKRSNGGFEPTVSVSTKKENDKLLITVGDNGNGIPSSIKDKIFQPFFTTKPTGQGTGLGLSLAYDIVKAHGGEIRVESKEGEGSEFIIEISTH